MTSQSLSQIKNDLNSCQICVDRFADTATNHAPRPIIWFQPTARILIAGQAPGLRVHESGIPFQDRSGDRLRDWMGLDKSVFYNQDQIAILPMAFCFPGYNAKGSDLLPPPICARTWRDQIVPQLPHIRLTLLIGAYAQKWHLGPRAKGGVTQTVTQWRSFLPQALPLPHPSWRNTAWIKRNPWFETDLLPELRTHVRNALETP